MKLSAFIIAIENRPGMHSVRIWGDGHEGLRKDFRGVDVDIPELKPGVTYTFKFKYAGETTWRAYRDVKAVPPPVTGSDTSDKRTVWGVTNNLDDNPKEWGPRLKDANLTVVRGWLTYPQDLSPQRLARLKEWKRQGFTTIVTLQPGEDDGKLGSVANVTAWANRNRTALEGGVDILAVGNEWNLDRYRPQDVPNAWHAAYVAGFLKPLRESLPNTKLACVPIAYNATIDPYVENYGKLLAAGAAGFCDYLDVHAYCVIKNIAALGEALKTIAAQWKRPLIGTELNLAHVDVTQWRASYPAYRAMINDVGFRFACHYRVFERSQSASHTKGWVCPFTEDGKPIAGVYELVRGDFAGSRVK